MKSFLVLFLLILSSVAKADDLHLLQPKEMFIDAYKYEDIHDPYLEPVDKDLLYGGAFNMNVYMLKYGTYNIYWDNMLHFDQSSRTGQIKHAGWQYELGISFLNMDGANRIELFRQHHSQHILEDTRPEHFPVYDRYGVRFRIYP